MFSVDTNVLARILVDDDTEPQQIKAARKFAEKNTPLLVAQIVQIELVWVLKYSFELDKQDIINILKHLLENEAFILHDEDLFEKALHLFAIANADFADCLILLISGENKSKVVTFDKKLSKLSNVMLLDY